MIDFLKKHLIMLMIILLIIIIAIITVLYPTMNKIGKENYVEIFRKNQNIFDEISRSLIPLEYDTSILIESGKIIVQQNGKAVGISEYLLDEKTKGNIERAIRDMGIRSITKSNTFIEFVYNSNKDWHSIVYATDNNQLISYTNVQHLEGNWYYCYIFNE